MTGGQDPNQFITDIQQRTPADAKNRLLANVELFKMLGQFNPDHRHPIVISDHEDTLFGAQQGLRQRQQARRLLGRLCRLCES